MKINSHCHIFSLDCVPEEFRDRFALNLDKLSDRATFWLVKTVLPDGSRPDDMLELADLPILDIALKLAREMDEAGIELCTPLMMDMEYCSSFEAGNIKAFEQQLKETEFAAQTVNKQYERQRLLPFIAVDPRRDGILDVVKRKIPPEKENRGVFRGIKIYPPMGFDLYDARLYPIYEYCAENAIPVTAHCASKGVPGLRYEDHERANPAHWRRVLGDFDDLVLNLAHNDVTGSDWQKEIHELVETYPNVYTDVSFNAEMWWKPRAYFKNVKRMLRIRDGDQRRMPHRLLFGTDWYMGRFLWTESSYLRWFGEFSKKIVWCRVWFSDEEIKRLTEDNPKKFLGL